MTLEAIQIENARKAPAARGVGVAVNALAAQLRSVAGDAARLEARLLAQRAAGLSAEQILAAPEAPLTADQAAALEVLAARRMAHEPMAYILGEKEFWSQTFETPPGVLIPRPDSETLVEAACGLFHRDAPLRILDLGVGSGCLLLSVLSEYPEARGVGVDISPLAAQCARTNARRLGVADRCAIVVGSWFGAVSGEFDLILANPPYIEEGAKDRLAPDIREFEPHEALFAGPDGLRALRKILRAGAARLRPGGRLLLEIGAGQADAVGALAAQSAGFGEMRMVNDLAGRARCALIDAPR